MKRIVRELTYTQENPQADDYENITFEQAFAEWETKPIAVIMQKIGGELVVGWVGNMAEDGRYHVYFTHQPNVHNYPPIFDFEIMAIIVEAYQASSWDDLHLNVIPTLIRMARGSS